MRSLCLVFFLTAAVMADKPAVAPAYVAPAAPAPDSYGSPIAAPSQDSYGSPVAAPVAAPAQDSYGSPQAPVVDSYGSPQAPAQTSYQEPAAANPAPVGNQGYYYYYYPVKQQGQQSYAAQEDDGGLLGGLGGIISAILGKKILLIAIGITGVLVLAALGINITGRSFDSITARAMPYMTEENLNILADFVQSSIETYQNLN